MTDDPLAEPHRPLARGLNHYKRLKQELTERKSKQDLFSIVLTASTREGEPMNEQQFLIDLVFKPSESGLRLRPAETQLLLAYIGEILSEVEIEEKRILEEEKRAAQEITARISNKETSPCK